MDVMALRRNLLMKKTGRVDLFNGSDLRNDCRIYASSPGSNVRTVDSTASKVYAFACAVTEGKQYKIQSTVTNPISINGRQCCISDANGIMLYYSGMVIRQNAGYNEETWTAHDTGYLWLTLDKNVSGIHIYEV